jgi:Diguanylate cyclase, GGDEF domain
MRTDKPIAPLKRLSFLEFPTLVEDPTIRVTVSVGVALSNDPTTDLGGLLEAADQALYRAKEAGRNCVETSSFAPELVPFRRPVGCQFRNDLPRRMDPDSPAAQRPFLAWSRPATLGHVLECSRPD